MDLSPNQATEAASDKIQVDQVPDSKAEGHFFSHPEPEKHRKHLENRQYEQDIKERKKFARYAAKFTITWICFLIAISFCQLILTIFKKGMDDAQFIAVITTTTTSVLGFWYLVGKYLFSDKPSPPGNG